MEDRSGLYIVAIVGVVAVVALVVMLSGGSTASSNQFSEDSEMGAYVDDATGMVYSISRSTCRKLGGDWQRGTCRSNRSHVYNSETPNPDAGGYGENEAAADYGPLAS